MSKRYWLGLCGFALAACSLLSDPSAAYVRSKVSPSVTPSLTPPDLSAANDGYRLSPDEINYDCKKLTGHIQLRIRQLRSTRADAKTSEIGRTMQKVATPLIGGTNRGIDQDGDNARDLSMLKAYNGRLAAKNCATFDLERLLAPGNTDAPRPIPKAKPATAPLQLKAPKAKPVAVPAAVPASVPAAAAATKAP
jgi:hypothetical protein